MEFVHKTVLLNEAVDALNCRDGKIYIDATAGGGGHSAEIAKRIGANDKLFAFVLQYCFFESFQKAGVYFLGNNQASAQRDNEDLHF